MRRPAKRVGKPLSTRALSTYYVSALLIIAGLTLASHLILAVVLNHNQGAASIINISGRQRMLSQRIASLAAQYRLGDRSAGAALGPAIAELQRNEAMLTAGVPPVDGGAADVQLRAIYADGFAAEVARFAADASQVAALPPGAPAAQAPLARLFAEARGPLIDKFNAVVTIHQRASEQVLVQLRTLQLGILVIVLLTLAAEAFAIFRPMIRRIGDYTEEILRLATIDTLTELANRRGFLDACDKELARARRYGKPLSLLMLDADHFKRINDSQGHAGGDLALRHIATQIRRTLRVSDVAGRLGGEEFGILLPETDLAGATQLAERLRQAIGGSDVPSTPDPIHLTVSIGVAQTTPGATSIEPALNAADLAMYRAKQAGRDRVVCAG